jgi:integrase
MNWACAGYSGARLSTACPLKISDFHQDGDEATIRLHEKGGKRRTIGLHFQAAPAVAEYIEKAGLSSGPLFRTRLNSRSEKLRDVSDEPVDDVAGCGRKVKEFLGQRHITTTQIYDKRRRSTSESASHSLAI